MTADIQQDINAALLDIVERCIVTLKGAEALPEPVRARVHALTRKVTISDAPGDAASRAARILCQNDGYLSNSTDILSEAEVSSIIQAEFAAQSTRKVTMSDEELDATFTDITILGVQRVARDLRDRYEERGKYAPTSPASLAPSPESQKAPSTQAPPTQSGPSTDEPAPTKPPR